MDTTQKVFANNEVQEDDGTSEFSQARQAALADAIQAKAKVTKTFVGKSDQIVGQIRSNVAHGDVKPHIVSTYVAPVTTIEKESKLKGKKNMKSLLVDDERDYREAKDAAKPSALTLFDLVKTRIGVEGNLNRVK